MQVLVNGLSQGLLFALMGVAFSLVYSTTRTFHIALGAIYAMAPYILLACLQAGMGWHTGIVVALVTCALAGLMCEEALHWPFVRRSAPDEVHIIASLGMFLVLTQIIAMIWGEDVQLLRTGANQVYSIYGTRISQSQIIGAGVSAVLLGVFSVGLRRSELGLQFRAMSANPTLLGILGRDVRNLRRMVFILSAVVAAMAAMLTAYDVGFDAHGGLQAVLLGMAATIIGGRGSFWGVVIAGLLLGVVRSEVVWLFSSRWEEAVTFLVLALVLLFRPRGLFGRAMRLEENA